MGFAKKSSVELNGRARSALSVWFLRCCGLFLRAGLAMSVIAILAGMVLMVRLQQGPIALPGIAKLVVDRLNADSAQFKLSVGNAVLSLGDGDTPSGLQFLDVQVHSAQGERLFNAPRIAARFLAEDVLLGKFRPIRVALIRPSMLVVRDSAGRFRVGLESDPDTARPDPEPGPASQERFDMLADALDSFVGDTASYPQLSRLNEISVVGADLTYVDEAAVRSWRTQDADVRISKHARGVRAVLTVDDIAGDTAGLSLRVLADRATGSGDTLLTLQFGRVAAKALATQAPGLDWMTLIDGEIEGRASAVLQRDGAIRDLSGVIIAESGALDLDGDTFPYDFARLAFEIDATGQSVEISEFTATSKHVGVRMNALASLAFDEAGAFSGLALDAELDRLNISLPTVFDDALAFDAAGLTARWESTSNEIEILSADLRALDTTYVLSGRLAAGHDDWLGDLRLSARDTSIAKVLNIWPLAAAKNARDWVDQNIQKATIPELLVNMRFGAGDPTLAMDFVFRDLDATYLDGMSPLRSVSGTGHVGYNGLELRIDDGFVQPQGQKRIALGGSRVSITGFWAEVTDADIDIAGRGKVQSVLALIDQKPLTLIRKLDVDLGPVGGDAALDVKVAFPLESDLLLEDVGVVAVARLQGLNLNYTVPSVGRIRVEADRADLRADTKALSLDANALLDGVPSTIAWREFYGNGRSGRTLDLKSATTQSLLAGFGIDEALLSGSVPFDLALAQTAAAPMTIAIDADLRDARMALDAIGWAKAPGARGRLELDLRPESDTLIERLRIDTSDLVVDGQIRLGTEGQIQRADLRRLALDDTFDVSASVRQSGANAFEVVIDGKYLNLPELLERRPEEDGPPTQGPEVTATLELDRLIASEDIRLTQTKGQVTRAADGALDARLNGQLAGRTPLEVILNRSANGAGKVTVTGGDAGEILRALDLYDEASGGALTLNADLNKETELDGIIRIQDLSIGDGSNVQQVLSQAGLEGGETVTQSSGLSFRKVWIPFTTANGRITLKDAIASGSALALKVNGSVDQEDGNLDLRGVISPAYGLTGALDNVPLLGTLLSGGEGEGILAMTFTLTGASKDPNFSINPLSLLTPGFLRNVFEGESSGSSEEFRQQIQQPDR